jgi:hypothetical protein
MRHVINSRITALTFKTCNPLPKEPTERYSYIIHYLDDASQPRESEEAIGFFDHEHALYEAKRNLDRLDMTPEVKTPHEPIITEPYHTHICRSGCGIHRCVNPKCEVEGEFSPRRVAEILCPVSGVQTGTMDLFKRRALSIVELMPLEVERAIAA